MDNEITEFLNQNWNDKLKSSVTSSSIHKVNNNNLNNNNNDVSNNNALNHPDTPEQYQQQQQQTRSQLSRGSTLSFQNIRLAFMHQRQAAGVQQNQNATNSPSPLSSNSSSQQLRNLSTTTACPKLIDISIIKGNAPMPLDCQSMNLSIYSALLNDYNSSDCHFMKLSSYFTFFKIIRFSHILIIQ